MRKIFSIALLAASIVACKKDDNGTGSNGSGGPQITGATFQTQYSAGATVSGYAVDSGIIATPVAGSDLTYNYANITMGAPWKDTLKTPANTADFPTATYMRGFNQSLLGQSASLDNYYQVSTSNWSNLGSYYNVPINVTVAQGSLSIPVQAAKQNPAITIINFPVSYGDSIAQTSTSSINASASATVSGFAINGPITTTQTTTVASKNIAWGTLKLKGYADSMQCVVQKYTTSIKTDVTSSNAILSSLIPTILSQYGVTNGQTVTLTTYRFWAANKGLVMTLNANGTANVTVL